MNALRFKLTASAVAVSAMIVLWGQEMWSAPPPGKGGGNNSDPIVTMTFRDDSLDGIYSDGDPYEGDTDGADIRFSSNGAAFYFNVSGPRQLWFDFSQEADPPECGGSCNKNFTITNTGDGAAGSVYVPSGFLGMAIGEMKLGEMKIGWGPADFRWSVRFQQLTGNESLDQSILSKTGFVEVTHPDENTWVIEGVGAGDRGLLWSRTGRGKHATYHDEGTYYLPFSLTVTR